MRRAAAIALAVLASPCRAEPQGAADTSVQQYCTAIADKAADARVAWQTRTLNDLQAEVEAKLAALDAKEKDLQAWVQRRDDMLKAANQSLVDIYAKMDPEAAAAQLAAADTATAVSVLHQLKPRNASAILDVMDPAKATMLVKVIADTARGRAGAGGGS